LIPHALELVVLSGPRHRDHSSRSSSPQTAGRPFRATGRLVPETPIQPMSEQRSCVSADMAYHPWFYRMKDLRAVRDIRWSSNESSLAGAPDEIFGTHRLGRSFRNPHGDDIVNRELNTRDLGHRGEPDAFPTGSGGNRADAKTPIPQIDGDRAFYFSCTPEEELQPGSGTQRNFRVPILATLKLRAACLYFFT